MKHTAHTSKAATALNGPARIQFNGSVELSFVQAKLTTSASVGNRTLALQILAADGIKVLFEKQQSLVVAASKTGVVFSFFPAAAPDKVTDLYSDVPIPEDLTVPSNGYVKIVDKGNIDAAGDTAAIEIQSVTAG
jgi:hypothetical protein